MPRHSRPMPLHNAQESSEKSIKAVIRENPLAGLGVALVGVAGGQEENMLRDSWLVKTQQAVLPARGTVAAHAAP